MFCTVSKNTDLSENKYVHIKHKNTVINRVNISIKITFSDEI